MLLALAGIALGCAGLVNLIVGFLALFPGLIESGVSESMAAGEQVGAMLGSPYALYAVAHLVGAGAQMLGASGLGLIARSGTPFLAALATLALVSLGLEAWGWLFKGYLTWFATPGVLAACLCTWLLCSGHRPA